MNYYRKYLKYKNKYLGLKKYLIKGGKYEGNKDTMFGNLFDDPVEINDPVEVDEPINVDKPIQVKSIFLPAPFNNLEERANQAKNYKNNDQKQQIKIVDTKSVGSPNIEIVYESRSDWIGLLTSDVPKFLSWSESRNGELWSESERGDIYPSPYYNLIIKEQTIVGGVLNSLLDRITNYYESNKKYEETQKIMTKVNISDPSNIVIIGDIHGSLTILLSIFKDLEDFFIDTDSFKLKENKHIFLLGDIVDYSPLGLECYLFALILLDNNPEQVHIINGNHETGDYLESPNSAIWKELNNDVDLNFRYKLIKLMNLTPIAMILKYKDNVFQLNHGAVPNNADDIYMSNIKTFINDSNQNFIIPTKFVKSYLWGDYIQNQYKQQNVSRPIVTATILEKYLNETGITATISGHQDDSPLGLIIPNNNNNSGLTKDVNIDGTNFYNTKKYSKYEYDLFSPGFILEDEAVEGKRIIFNSISNSGINRYNDKIADRKEVKYVAGIDFIALITSAAGETKFALPNYVFIS